MSTDDRRVAVIVDGYIYGHPLLDTVELHDITDGHCCVRCCEQCRAYARDAERHRAAGEAHASTDRSLPYVILTKVHTRDCRAVRSELNRAERGITSEQYHDGALFTRWPTYVDRDTAAASEAYRCRACCPDLPAPYDRKQDPMRSRIRCTGTGWPEDDGTCARSRWSRTSRLLMQGHP